MKHHTIAGGDGSRAPSHRSGQPARPGDPVSPRLLAVFAQPGAGSSARTSRDNYRLVAMDLRGHGSSDKPRDAYGDSRLWADDVDAAIRELELDQPILCGWSYGPLVILDYIRHYGEEAIGGHPFRRTDHEARQRGGGVGARRRNSSRSCRGSSRPTRRRACAAWSPCCACASLASRRRRSCTRCSATTCPFRRSSARRCSRVRSTTTTFCRRFESRC